jgi:hypothetical protein
MASSGPAGLIEARVDIVRELDLRPLACG